MSTTTSDSLRDTAQVMAAMIVDHCDVESVYLFGSVARLEANETSDIDLILCVDDETHKLWLQFCAAYYNVYLGGHVFDVYSGYTASIRLMAAQASIPHLEDMFMARVHQHAPRYGWDLLVLPVNWRSRLSELQETGAHQDPDFMEKINEDAILIESSQAWMPAAP